MKTLFLTLLLFFSVITLTAQEVTPQKKWHFGAELFPNYTDLIIKNNGTGDIGVEATYNDLEMAKFCLSGQIYASYNLSSRSSISFGIGYQNTGNQTKKQSISYGNPGDTVSASMATHVKFIYNNHNIQIPVFYTYSITNRFYARAGVSTIFNFSNTITQVLIDFNGRGTRSTNEDSPVPLLPFPEYRTLNFSGNLGVGYSYYKTSNLDLYVQANIETAFMQLRKDAPLNRRPVSIGLIFGARI